MAQASKNPQGPQSPATPEPSDVKGSFSHMAEEFTELEGQHGPRWALLVAALVLIGAVAGAYYWSTTSRAERLAPPVPIEGVLIEVSQPRAGSTLDVAPQMFGWETVAGRDHYLFTVKLEDAPAAVIERSSKSSTLTLTQDEQKLLGSGNYIWIVRARAKDGTVLGTGHGRFRILRR